MNLFICFWDETDNDVKVRYFGSSFFQHAIAKDLSRQFKEITKSLVSTKIFRASMDESNINLKVYEALKQERNKNLFLSLIDTDTCSLHFVQQHFETAFWGIKETLAGAFHFCMNSQPDVKILKLLKVQTSIHSFFVLQVVLKGK